MCDPEVELVTLMDRLGMEPLHGHAGVRAWFARLAGLWAFVDLKRYTEEDLGAWLLVNGTSVVRGKASADELAVPWACAVRFNGDGLIGFLGLYVTREEALDAIEVRNAR